MKTGFKSQCVPEYRLLNQTQIDEMHRATLEVLETIGVKVHHEKALELLRDAGCQVKEDLTVLIPNWLVEESIRSTPSQVMIYDRDGNEAMCLEGNNIHFGLGTDLLQTYDIHTGELRDACLMECWRNGVLGKRKPTLFLCNQRPPAEVVTAPSRGHPHTPSSAGGR